MKTKYQNTLKVEEVRSLFVDKKTGLPKSECLLSLDQICKKLRKPLPENYLERAHVMNVNLATMGNIKRVFLKRHVLFISPLVADTVYYGFTHDMNLIDNYIERLRKTETAYRMIEKTVKQLVLEAPYSKQLSLTE